jgi:hypothetical protein
MGIRKDGFSYYKIEFGSLKKRDIFLARVKKQAPYSGLVDTILSTCIDKKGKTVYRVTLKSEPAQRKEWLQDKNDRAFDRYLSMKQNDSEEGWKI